MRKIIFCAFLTLDGVMQAPGSPDEDARSGFEHGGWQKPVADDEAAETRPPPPVRRGILQR